MTAATLTDEEIARIRAPLPRSWTLPPAAYTDPAIWEREQKTIFARDWLCVARVDQIPKPGDYLSADLPGQPIVLARDHGGTLRALSRICLHLAMPVIEGNGNATRLVCPYHKWTYELDGALRSAPMMDGVTDFEPSRCRLPEIRLEIWNGFVFVNLDPTAEPLAPRLTRLAAFIERHDFGDLVVAASTEFDSPWNWKILVENFMEAYHHIGPHRQTFEPTFPARDSSVPDNGGAPWTFLRMPARSGAGGSGHLSPTRRRRAEPAARDECLPDAAVCRSPQRRGLVSPRAQGPRCHAPHHPLSAASGDRGVAGRRDPNRDHRAGAGGAPRGHRGQRGPWRGLQSVLTTQGRLSTFEAAIWQLNQLWLDRVLPA